MIGDSIYTTHTGVSLNLNNNARYILEGRPKGIMGLATEPVSAAMPRKRFTGVYQGNNATKRVIEQTVIVRGDNAADVQEHIYAMKAHLGIDSDGDAQGVWMYEGENHKRYCAKVAVIDTAEGLDSQDQAQRGSFQTAKVVLRLEASDATFYDPILKQATGVFAGVGAVAIACTNAGNAPGYASLVYACTPLHTLTNPRVTDYAGHVLLIEGVLAVNEYLIVMGDPSSPYIVYSAVPTNWWGNRGTASQLVEVSPGTHNMTFAAGAAGDNADITVGWHDRYLSFGG